MSDLRRDEGHDFEPRRSALRDSGDQDLDARAGGAERGGQAPPGMMAGLQDRLGSSAVQRKLVQRRAGSGKPPVQRLGYDLSKPLPAGAEKPAEGEDAGHQRRYSVEQFIAMWEKEQGHKLSPQEQATLARGCIGITAMNLHAGGNPPLDNAYGTFEEAQAAQKKMNLALDKMRRDPHLASQVGNKHAVIFAKLFWSNQDPDQEKRKSPDKDAYKPDPHTGKVDMSGYAYRAQPGYVNFDYGFWDDASHSFWHANHSQPGMKVYQSTRDKFAKGYIDFDRIIYCAAIAENYDPVKAAIATARPH